MKKLFFILTMSFLLFSNSQAQTFGAMGQCNCKVIEKGNAVRDTGIPWVKTYFSYDLCEADRPNCSAWCSQKRVEPKFVDIGGDFRCVADTFTQKRLKKYFQRPVKLGERILLKPSSPTQNQFMWLDSEHVLFMNRIVQIPNGWEIAGIAGAALVLIYPEAKVAKPMVRLMRLTPALP